MVVETEREKTLEGPTGLRNDEVLLGTSDQGPQPTKGPSRCDSRLETLHDNVWGRESSFSTETTELPNGSHSSSEVIKFSGLIPRCGDGTHVLPRSGVRQP